MGLLVGGRAQVLHDGRWLERMNVTFEDTGNAMTPAEITFLSAAINIHGLQAYRLAVGRRTRRIVSRFAGEALKDRVDSSRLQRIADQGAVPAGSGLLDYWGRRTIAELLLMPPTRHNFIHLNDARSLKQRQLIWKRRTKNGNPIDM